MALGSKVIHMMSLTLLITFTLCANASFRDKALSTCVNDTMAKLNLSSLSSVTKLKCHNKGIKTLQGIEQLSSLRYLSVFGNKLTSLDVTKLNLLTHLNVAKNNLSTLEIAGLSNLTELFAFKNKLSTVDLKGLGSLVKLRMMDNQLQSLDIAPLVSLEAAYLWNNQLKDLDISGLANLKFLDVKQNPMPDELYDFYDEQVGITISHDGNADDWK